MSTRTAIDYSMYVGGAWAESESGARIEATSPATGETIGSVPEGTRDDARRAIAAANAAAREWAGPLRIQARGGHGTGRRNHRGAS